MKFNHQFWKGPMQDTVKKLSLMALFCVGFAMHGQDGAHFRSSGMYFSQPMDARKWNNKTTESSAEAKFRDFTGESYVALSAVEAVEVTLRYQIRLTEGSMELLLEQDGVRSPLSTLKLNGGNGVNKNEKVLKLAPGVRYRLVWSARDAKGSFDCSWAETNKTNH